MQYYIIITIPETDALAFDEFGVAVVGAKNLHNPFGFTCYQMDEVSGLYYAQARYFEPNLGRFTAQDTHWNPGNMIFGDEFINMPHGALIPNVDVIMQNSNLYVYCMNNPIFFNDFTGNVAYTHPHRGGYRYQVANRKETLAFLAFGSVPIIGTIINVSNSAAQALGGMKEINGNAGNTAGDAILQANEVLRFIDDNLNVLKNTGFLRAFSKFLGIAGNIGTGIEIINFFSNQQSDIIDQIIAKQFKAEMFSDSRELLGQKYSVAHILLQSLISQGKLTYSYDWIGDLKKYHIDAVDIEIISQILQALDKDC